MSSKLVMLLCCLFINSCRSDEAATYRAAVVELNPLSWGHTAENVLEATKQVIEIIGSNELNGVDIVVLPEVILNQKNTAVLLPNTNRHYCDEPAVDKLLRSVSCAVRKAKKYVIIDLYVKVKCSLDDQSFCAHEDSTNMYNMAIVFDRNGDVIAKYRKYHLFGEHGVQQTQKPDLITFKTDFNVTFGVFICFDLMFAEPVLSLVNQGVKHFVYPTMWYSEIPYFTAAQYQQSWAYANDVTLLAANVNAPRMMLSGSGIYSGRSGALQVIVNESPATKILVADVPIESPSKSFLNGNQFKTPSTSSLENHSNECRNSFGVSAVNLMQDDLSEYTVTFLNFADSLSQSGRVCNNGICCNYNIEVSDNGDFRGKSSYSYAISVFDGRRTYKSIKNLFTAQKVCSLIACTQMDSKKSCGLRTPPSQVHNRYTFEKLSLQTALPVNNRSKTMPNTLTGDLLPLDVTEFEYKTSEAKERFVVELNLNVPKSDLLTFAILSRDYNNDVINDH